MKILFVCLLVIFIALSTSSFAAKSNKNINPKVEARELQSDAGRIGFGLTNTTYGIAGLLQVDKIIPTIRYNFTGNFNGIFGLSLSSSNIAGNPSELGLLIRSTWGVSSFGANTLLLGLTANYISNVQSLVNSSSFNLGLMTGIDLKMNPSVVVGAYIVPLSITSSSIPGIDGSNINIFNNAILSAHCYL